MLNGCFGGYISLSGVSLGVQGHLKVSQGGGGPKDPQLSKSLNALKQVFKSGWNVFDFSNNYFKKILNQEF